MRRPRHARPSLLAPNRALICWVLSVGLGVGALAAGASGPAGAAPRPTARSAPAAALGAKGPTPPATVEQTALRLADRAAVKDVPPTQPPKPVRQPSNALADFRDVAPASLLASSGIPVTALQAYEQAASREQGRSPGCGLTWPLLAGIGRVESDHGRFAGAVLHADGLSTPPVIGIALNGHGTALIPDTDHGRLDGDTVYDHAVGPMQFIPSTWAGWGVDANHDGVKDPFNIFDAVAAAADYLCAAGRDLTTTRGQVQAILSYNYSYDYVSMVMSLERIYATEVGITVPVLPTSRDLGRPVEKPPLPPVDPGTPRGATAPAPSSSPTAKPSPAGSTAASSSATPSPAASSAGATDSSSATDSPSTSPSSPSGAVTSVTSATSAPSAAVDSPSSSASAATG